MLNAVIAIALVCIWFRLFYWFRLFNSTAFFINLLTRTFKDINFVSFTIMMFILMCAYGNLTYVFNTKRGDDYETNYFSYDSNGQLNARIFE